MFGHGTKLVLALLFVLVVPQWAHAERWVASKVAQPASYMVDNKKWKTIKRGMTIPKRSWIRTGSKGRLVLKRGKEMIMYRPKTMASVQQPGQWPQNLSSTELWFAAARRRNPSPQARDRQNPAACSCCQRHPL